jgi:hypothetical protein
VPTSRKVLSLIPSKVLEILFSWPVLPVAYGLGVDSSSEICTRNIYGWCVGEGGGGTADAYGWQLRRHIWSDYLETVDGIFDVSEALLRTETWLHCYCVWVGPYVTSHYVTLILWLCGDLRAYNWLSPRSSAAWPGIQNCVSIRACTKLCTGIWVSTWVCAVWGWCCCFASSTVCGNVVLQPGDVVRSAVCQSSVCPPIWLQYISISHFNWIWRSHSVLIPPARQPARHIEHSCLRLSLALTFDHCDYFLQCKYLVVHAWN